LLATAPAARADDGPGEAEASRQLRFARQELRDGAWSKALRSAESAQRLAPGLHEALYLKALAWEGQGDLALAETALQACIEQGCEAEVPRVRQALERIRMRLHEEAERDRSAGPTRIRPRQEVWSGGPIDLDPGPWRERSQRALGQSLCSAAEVAAVELTRAAPDLPDGYRLLGDAARCEQRARAAVLAYREYVRRGGGEPAVLEVLEGLARSLSTLHVTVRLDDPDVVPRLQVDLRGERVEPAFQNSAFGTATAGFADLPVAAPVRLVVAGRGLQAEVHDLTPLAAGEERKLEVAPKTVGLGTVTIGEHDPDSLTVEVRSPDEVVVVGPGDSRTVTAGPIEVAVTSNLGTVVLPLTVPRRGTERFEPAERLPTALTIRGLPAGCLVRVFVYRDAEAQIEQRRRPPPDLGAIDLGSGLRIAPPQRIDSLLGGAAGVWVEHPVLGQLSYEQQLEPGAENGSVFDAAQMPGARTVGTAWQGWRQGSEALQRKRRGGAAASAIVGGLMMAGGGAALGLSQVAANARIRPEVTWRMLEEAGLPHERSRAEAERLERQQEALLWGGVGAISVGVGGISISLGLGAKARAAAKDTGDWDPWATE